MSNNRLYIVEKPFGLSCIDYLVSNIEGATLTSRAMSEYEDEGEFESAMLRRGQDWAGIGVVLGDRTDPRGPYGGKCWVLVNSGPWWRRRWNKLPHEIKDAVVERCGIEAIHKGKCLPPLNGCSQDEEAL